MITIRSEEFRDVILIGMYGILTRECLKDAEEAWREQLEKKPGVLALDLRELSQVDSISLNHLVKLARAANEHHVRLIICGVNESLMKIFEVIKLDRIVEFVPWKKFENEFITGS